MKIPEASHIEHHIIKNDKLLAWGYPLLKLLSRDNFLDRINELSRSALETLINYFHDD
jgi:hypothetical protein